MTTAIVMNTSQIWLVDMDYEKIKEHLQNAPDWIEVPDIDGKLSVLNTARITAIYPYEEKVA
jgi:hypothetical protein